MIYMINYPETLIFRRENKITTMEKLSFKHISILHQCLKSDWNSEIILTCASDDYSSRFDSAIGLNVLGQWVAKGYFGMFWLKFSFMDTCNRGLHEVLQGPIQQELSFLGRICSSPYWDLTHSEITWCTFT